MAIQIEALDHLVLTVSNIETSCRFYRDVLGMEIVTFGTGRKALRFGQQKINLHRYQHEFEPKVKKPIPGSADLCLVSHHPVSAVIDFLRDAQVDVEEGPVKRTGARGEITSVYIRDPDGNLIEICHYAHE